jgi:glycerol-3-phosphate acyltransferase PlsY
VIVFLRFAALVILAWLIGSIPTGFLLVKICKKQDVRKQGSGNIGFTNVLRTSGILLGLTVLVIDVAKAWLATRYLSGLLPSTAFARPIIGIAVIIGNIFNPFLKFRGGKGVATGLGVAIAISPFCVLYAVGAFGLAVLATRYVSIGSLSAASVFTICTIICWIRGTKDIYTLVFSVLLSIAVFLRHITNIQRLLHGEENKIGKRKNSSE